MRDIEQTGGCARVKMLVEHAWLELDRHLITGKWHHPCAQLHVQGVQWRMLKCLIRCHGRGRVQGAQAPVAVVSTTSKSWMIVAVLAIIADAEQYFSTDSAMARSTFSAASRRPFTTKCM